MKIKDLKIGTRVFLGRYSCDRAEMNPPDISWIRASKDYFISEYALDMLIFDESEPGEDRITAGHRYTVPQGNNSYEYSNIRQYLNSREENWFLPTHSSDRPPYYANRVGFMYYFEDYEIEAINNEVELPTVAMIREEFPLFRRKGLRAHPSSDLVDFSRRSYGLEDMARGSYTDTMTRDPGCVPYAINCISRGSGTAEPRSVFSRVGVRPIVKIKENLNVIPSDGGFSVASFEFSRDNDLTEDDLRSFLGL